MMTPKKSQSKSKSKAVDYPFCRQPWHIGAMLLGVCYIFTLVWSFHLLHDDLDESLEYLGLKKVGDSRKIAPDKRVVTAALQHALPPGVVPAEMRVRAALVNIAGIRAQKGGAPGPFTSAGSGVLVTASGYVVTAAHVVEGLTEILVRVQTPSGPRQYTAQVVKTAPSHDVAMLKLASRDLFPYLPLAPDTVVTRAGEAVVAWGDSNSTDVMANRGQVRQVDATAAVGGVLLTHLLQTDAVSHWSQSGGPLLDSQGRMVGINIAAQSASGLVGYAVPTSVLWAHFQDVVTFPQVVPPAGQLTPQPPAPQPGVGPAVPAAAANGSARMVPVAAQMGMGNGMGPGMGNGVGGGGRRELRRADEWWAQAQAVYGLNAPTVGGGALPQGGGPPASGWNPAEREQALGVHVAMAQPAMVPAAVHLGEPLVWGYPVQTLLGLVALGLISGISGGMMTMGGGIIKVTGLMLFFGYGLLLIRPVAYITNIFLYGAAVLRYRRYGLIVWESVRGLIPWAMMGVVMGYFLGNVIGNQWIRYLLGLFAALVGVRMLVEILAGRVEERPDPFSLERGANRRRSWLYYLGIGQPPEGAQAPVANHLTRDGILGLPMGIISGILGITGGVIEVPLQRYVAGVPLRSAIANSAVLVFFASLVGSVVAMTHGIQSGAFDWSAPVKLAVILVPGAYVGGLIGAWLTKVVSLGVLRWFYAVLMFVIAGRMFMP
ncbi:MAG: TSUP family transporter [Magnetococcales bacterium]|nr:TSUP family transporter [Magnetococcales bacterium]